MVGSNGFLFNYTTVVQASDLITPCNKIDKPLFLHGNSLREAVCLFVCLFALLLYVPVNSYGHGGGGTVSSPGADLI